MSPTPNALAALHQFIRDEEIPMSDRLGRILDALASSGQAASAVTEGVTAWLIERKASRFGPAAWWAGCGPHFNIDDDRCWTQDANMAIKFVDAQSARHAQWTLLRMAHQTARDGRLEVTEHMWPSPTQPASAPAREGLHPATADLVARFALALSDKLAAAEKKYGYSDGWLSPDWMDECRQHLREHIEKGDPRDVAAYCAFLWHHGSSTASPTQPASAPAREGLRCADCDIENGCPEYCRCTPPAPRAPSIEPVGEAVTEGGRTNAGDEKGGIVKRFGWDITGSKPEIIPATNGAFVWYSDYLKLFQQRTAPAGAGVEEFPLPEARETAEPRREAP